MNYCKYIFFRNCSVDIIRTNGSCMLSRVQLFATPWTVALQAPLSSSSSVFSGKNTGVGCHFLLQGNLLDPGIKPVSPALPG